ncbi:MAG: asparaginyl/glutamyl-tRNA amidotransferase subunit C [Cycloclasticus sp. symbiont of Poecilosclerida sp. M]|nr:MAG: asparaginyl/glutamyl-tRNA amidotransferase subunit C [Cycloclasticus sp. symbiont of Poecilosclerida sp. M]
MSIQEEDVRKIAHLARIEIQNKDTPAYASDLTNIMGLVAQMAAVDTSNIEPMAHPMEQTQRLRVDEVTEQDNREKFQSIAPDVEQGVYLVPRVIE